LRQELLDEINAVAGLHRVKSELGLDEISQWCGLVEIDSSLNKSSPIGRDVIDRTEIFSELEKLLPRSSEHRGAAFWGLGGSE
jgi:hypothetical protein